MELLFKQPKQNFPLRYFYGENVPEGVSSDSNIIVPLRSTLSSPIRWAICITIPAGSYATRFDAGRITKEDAVSYLKSLQKQLRRKLRREKN